MTSDRRIALNRANWNERTRVHAGSDFYDVAGFKDGRITLNEFERAGVGDVRGKSFLHLQCHFGLDTLSWARLGANATGVDISDDAIGLARKLNDEVGLDAKFVRSDIYDLPQVLDGEFDIVYTAMGVLAWLPDLAAWAEVVARYLKPRRALLPAGDSSREPDLRRRDIARLAQGSQSPVRLFPEP